MRQRPAEYIPQIPEQLLLLLLLCPQEADEITWPKCARRTTTCYPVETNSYPSTLAAACNVYAPVYLHSEWGGGRGKFI